MNQQPSTSSSPPMDANQSALIGSTIHKQILRNSVGAVCKMAGFDLIQDGVLSQLAQMTSNFLNEVCRSAKESSDHTGRTEVTPGDAFLGLVDTGTNIAEFRDFLNSVRVNGTLAIPNPELSVAKPATAMLKIASPRPHPAHMPSFLPPFPDPHTYIRTEVAGDVDSNYEKVRRVTAENRRDVENSLENFALAIHPSISVFQDLEKAMYAEAKQVISQQKLEKRQRLEAIKAAKNSQREATNTGAEGSDVSLNNLASEEEGLEVLDVEDLLKLEETEKSYVRKRIPAYCQILLPFEEDHPYLSALVTDDNLDDDQNHFARILSQEMEDDLNDELMDSSNSMNGGDMD